MFMTETHLTLAKVPSWTECQCWQIILIAVSIITDAKREVC